MPNGVYKGYDATDRKMQKRKQTPVSHQVVDAIQMLAPSDPAKAVCR